MGNAKSINYSEVFVASWPVLDEVLMEFPHAAEHIRSCALRLAMRRMIVRAARAMKELTVQSVLDIREEDMKDVDMTRSLSSSKSVSVLSRSGSDLRQAPKRAKTIKKMFETSTHATDAEVQLQSHLIVQKS